LISDAHILFISPSAEVSWAESHFPPIFRPATNVTAIDDKFLEGNGTCCTAENAMTLIYGSVD